MTFKHQPLQAVSLSKQIADQIRSAILEGTLKADDRLPSEEELAARYQVSRPTIREALKRLAAQNLVRSRRGPAGGTFVNRIRVEEVADQLTSAMTLLVSMGEFDLPAIAESRRELETLCCRLAAQNRQSEHLQQLRGELDQQSDPQLAPEAFCASDVRFHRILADATGNPVLGLLMQGVIEALQPVSNMVAYRYRDPQRVVSQHRRLLEAIDNRDANTAVAIIQEQVSELLEQQHLAAEAHQQRHASDY